MVDSARFSSGYGCDIFSQRNFTRFGLAYLCEAIFDCIVLQFQPTLLLIGRIGALVPSDQVESARFGL
jgi:hypothetical protein